MICVKSECNFNMENFEIFYLPFMKRRGMLIRLFLLLLLQCGLDKALE